MRVGFFEMHKTALKLLTCASLASAHLAALFDLHLHPECTWAIKQRTHTILTVRTLSAELPLLHPCTPSLLASQVYS